MTTFDPGPLAEVSVTRGDHGWTLVFVKDFKHPPEKVWAALTQPDQVGAWAPFLTDRDLAKTGDAVLTMVDGDTRVDSSATVRVAEPPSVLEYAWGDDLLRWELAATASGTRLTLSHTHAERASLPMFAAGWHLCLLVAERLLDGAPIAPIRGSAAMGYGFTGLRDGYARVLG